MEIELRGPHEPQTVHYREISVAPLPPEPR
jgi:hypothetical protein